MSPAPLGNKNHLDHFHTDETKEKIRRSLSGRKASGETKAKLSEFQTARFADPANRASLSEAQRGRTVSDATRTKIGNAHRGKKISDEQKLHLRSLYIGTKLPEITKEKIRANTPRAEESPHWKGGVSFAPYCPKFTREFKDRVRAFFGNRCVVCGKTPEENGKALTVHHVNYDKAVCCNTATPLFAAVCVSHNTIANNRREYWERFFTELIRNRYNGKCYFTKEEMKQRATTTA